MVVEIEVGVLDPHGVMEPEGHPHHAPAQGRDQVDALLHDGAQPVEVRACHVVPASVDVGSKTMTAPTCMCMVSVSRARKAASSPLETLHVSIGRGSRSPVHGARLRRPGPRFIGRCGRSHRDPGGVGQLALVYLHELGLLHRLDDELGDAVTPVHLVGRRGVGVDEQDAQFVAVAGVDEPGGVETGHAVAQGQPAARLDEAGVARRQGEATPGGHEGPASAGGEDGVFARVEVGPGVARARVGGHGQVGIEEDEGHLEHRMTLSSVTRCGARTPGPGRLGLDR